MKTAELTSAALDWAVAKCEYPELIWGETIGLSAHACDLIVIPQFKEPKCWWCPSTNWAQSGPIIERERIDLVWNGDWFAETDAANRSDWVATGRGRTPLIAAMRCYVASKLGDDVDVPKELT